MSENLYAPPATPTEDPVRDAGEATEFFVVGPTKLLLLYFATFGLYKFFWFYMHWARYKRHYRHGMWPVARAVLAIFFVNPLAGEIDDRLKRDGHNHAWSPTGNAGAYVILVVASYICDRIPEGVSNVADVLPLVLWAPIAWPLVNIQRAANIACGQRGAASNRQLTWANWLWLVAGGLVWTLLFIGIALPDI